MAADFWRITPTNKILVKLFRNLSKRLYLIHKESQ